MDLMKGFSFAPTNDGTCSDAGRKNTMKGAFRTH